MKTPAPVVERYGNVSVVRDDLIPGGTKARFIDALFTDIDEMVYASPTQGGAQTALAYAARRLNKRLTLVVAKSNNWHPRVQLSKRLGANIIEVPMGFLSNVQSAARKYAQEKKLYSRDRVYNLEFGMGTEDFIDKIAEAAGQIPRPVQLWCAAGSGTLARGLARAWPDVPRFVVQCGHKLATWETGGGTVIVFPRPYSYQEKRQPPFPSDPTYERKAYFTMLEHIGDAEATFWNTASSAFEEMERAATEQQGDGDTISKGSGRR